MENSNYKPGNLGHNMADTQAKIKESASDLLHESKKLANDLYQQSVDKVGEKVGDVEDCVHEYSDKLINKIHANPLSSVLVAVGVGMFLHALLKK
jgi:ElaB/YqjD/DUF883 family membrane-anchored ribosome-binding protein